jgi:hypothetical protein
MRRLLEEASEALRAEAVTVDNMLGEVGEASFQWDPTEVTEPAIQLAARIDLTLERTKRKPLPPVHLRCLAEITLSQADAVRGAASILLELILQTQDVHGGGIEDFPDRIESVFRLIEDILDYYAESDPEAHCQHCATVPGQ